MSAAEARLRPQIVALVDLYCELCRVNRRIGIWDTRRHEVCNRPLAEIDTAYLVKTERLGRQNVERRAELKSRMDDLFVDLVAAQARSG